MLETVVFDVEVVPDPLIFQTEVYKLKTFERLFQCRRHYIDRRSRVSLYYCHRKRQRSDERGLPVLSAGHNKGFLEASLLSAFIPETQKIIYYKYFPLFEPKRFTEERGSVYCFALSVNEKPFHEGDGRVRLYRFELKVVTFKV